MRRYRAQSMSNCWAIKTLGRGTQEAEQKRSRRQKINPKQILRIQSKIDTIMRPIAQQIIIDINDGNFIKEMGLRLAFEECVG